MSYDTIKSRNQRAERQAQSEAKAQNTFSPFKETATQHEMHGAKRRSGVSTSTGNSFRKSKGKSK